MIGPGDEVIQKQANIVKSFTERNGLKLTTEKLELLAMSDGNCSSDCEVRIGATSVSSSSTAKSPRCDMDSQPTSHEVLHFSA